jgi:hypothetical protein
MKVSAWAWLGLLALPGCLLIQPLDDAKPNQESGGSSGKAGQHAGGSGPGAGGAGNKAGSGPSGGSDPIPAGGTDDSGGTGGVDFSLFLGRWTLISGTYARKCASETTSTTGTINPGEVDTFVPGTEDSQSDLIFDVEGTDVCNVFANVDDRSAYGTGDQACTVDEADGSTTYLTYNYFEFAVSADGQSALSTWDVSALNDGTLDSCDSEVAARFQRADSNN